MSGLAFNHAMIYSRDVEASLHFYKDLLSFEPLEEFRHQGRLVYARLKSPASDTTIALHAVEPGGELHTGGIRLYFEVESLDDFCAALAAKGVNLSKPPRLMPWGWTHAYLDDPDGHEISLFSAGAARLAKVKSRPAMSG